MKWTVDEAKKFATKLGLDLVINVDNLDEVAKKIRKKLRAAGTSIRDYSETTPSAPKEPKERKSKPKVSRSKSERVIPEDASVKDIAEEVARTLAPYCFRIAIAGSIRRRKPNPSDIDIVLIPKDRKKLDKAIEGLGSKVRGGEKIMVIMVRGIQVDINFAESSYWGAALMRATGPAGYNIGLSKIAANRGWTLSQYGIIDQNGEQIAGETEESIYDALDKDYKEPEARGKK